MEELEESRAVLVIYDHDLTLNKRHSNGAQRRRTFENPYAANLRVLPALRTHIQELRSCKNKRVLFGVATLGEFNERIIESWKAIGVNTDELLICGKYVDEELLVQQGKNWHIANILSQHYSKYPTVRIERIYLVDDSECVLNALQNYTHFIRHSSWQDDPRFYVPIEGVRMPQPRLEYRMVEEIGEIPKALLVMHPHPEFETQTCTELGFSERGFVEVLSNLEAKIDNRKKFAQLQKSFPLSEHPNPKGCREKRALSRSWDCENSTEFYTGNPFFGATKNRALVNSRNSSYSGSEEDTEDDTLSNKLFKSM